MIIPLYATSTGQVADKLVEIRFDGGLAALSRLLTLIVECDAAAVETSIQAANLASMEHPCRVIVVTAEELDGPASLDAQIRVGSDAGASEVVVLRLRGEGGNHLAAVVTPLLLPDTPVVTWWPAARPPVPALHPLGKLASRRVTDATANQPAATDLPGRIAQLQLLTDGYTDGDTDLAWTRLTPWRSQLVAALNISAVEPITSATVSGPSVVTSELLAAWLAELLGVQVRREQTDTEFLTAVELHLSGGGRILLDKGLEESQAVLRITDQVERIVSLARYSRPEALAEELRRLEVDHVYGRLATRAVPDFIASGGIK
jgi:glucose-6-phosphate dehydrogenase assembly protein OpcA